MASVGETVAKTKAAAISPRQASPQKTLISAVSSGTPAASTLPKPTSSTRIATAKPITSLITSLGSGRASSPSGPPYSTSTPAERSGRTAASTPFR